MSIKHFMYAIDFRCITSKVDASILSGFPSLKCTSSQRSLHTNMSLIFTSTQSSWSRLA